MMVTNDILLERERQDEKWGVQHWPDGTHERYRFKRDEKRRETERAAEDGDLSWALIAWEEFYEAMAETEWPHLRAELVQLAAVVCAWIQDGDSRSLDQTLVSSTESC